MTIQKAANKKANQLMKAEGNNQQAFEKVWKSIAWLYPTANTFDALDYANKLKARRELRMMSH